MFIDMVPNQSFGATRAGFTEYSMKQCVYISSILRCYALKVHVVLLQTVQIEFLIGILHNRNQFIPLVSRGWVRAEKLLYKLKLGQ